MRLVGSRRGAGLVDVMLTLFLLGVAGMIFAASFPVCFRATRQAQEYKLAAAISQKKMEQLRAMNYESLTSSHLQSASVVDSTSVSSPYSFTAIDGVGTALPLGTGEITIEDVGSDTRKVTVSMSWKGPGEVTRTMETVSLFVDRRTRKIS